MMSREFYGRSSRTCHLRFFGVRKCLSWTRLLDHQDWGFWRACSATTLEYRLIQLNVGATNLHIGDLHVLDQPDAWHWLFLFLPKPIKRIPSHHSKSAA